MGDAEPLFLVDHQQAQVFERHALLQQLVRADQQVHAAVFGGLQDPLLLPGGSLDGIRVEAVAAYNTTEGHLQFHPREREDCGYVLTLGGTRVYIAGDSEPTPEMRSLEGIDIAFLPVNQPYTMTVDQAAEAVRALRPAIFYPYHYGEVEQITDLDRLAREVAGLTEMRVRPME